MLNARNKVGGGLERKRVLRSRDGPNRSFGPKQLYLLLVDVQTCGRVQPVDYSTDHVHIL